METLNHKIRRECVRVRIEEREGGIVVPYRPLHPGPL